MFYGRIRMLPVYIAESKNSAAAIADLDERGMPRFDPKLLDLAGSGLPPTQSNWHVLRPDSDAARLYRRIQELGRGYRRPRRTGNASIRSEASRPRWRRISRNVGGSR